MRPGFHVSFVLGLLVVAVGFVLRCGGGGAETSPAADGGGASDSGGRAADGGTATDGGSTDQGSGGDDATDAGNSDAGTDAGSCEKVVVGPATYVTADFDAVIQAPSGAGLYVRVTGPDPEKNPGKCFPVLVEVPGGLGNGAPAANGPPARTLAAHGTIFVAFNAEGRGTGNPGDQKSGGDEDYNGFRHQDGLKSVIEFAASLDGVDKDNIGVRTSSYGITMGAGCLGRYPELPVSYLVDVEGPSDSYVTIADPWTLDSDPSNDKTDKTYGIFGYYSLETDPSADNQAFWAERQAKLFIGSARVRYLRVQAEWDHMQPPNEQFETGFDKPPQWFQNKHAIDMVNAAVAGGTPWVRMNRAEHGNQPGATYDHDHAPVWVPGKLADSPQESDLAVIEMSGGMLLP